MRLKTKEKTKSGSCSCGHNCEVTLNDLTETGAKIKKNNLSHEHTHNHDHDGEHENNHDESHGHEHSHGKKIFPLNIVVFITGFILMGITFTPSVSETIKIVVSVVLYAYFGLPIIINMIKEITEGEIFNENTLMTIASVGALCIGEFHDAAAVVFLYSFGEYLQDKAFNKSKKSIMDMLVKNPSSAVVIRNGEHIKINIENVKTGEEIVVKPGESIPLDGVVTEGSAFADSSAITGESVPITLDIGVEALSGCTVTGGTVVIKTTKLYSDSTVSLVAKAVVEANKKKSETEKFILRFSRVYTPIVAIIAVLTVAVNIFILKNEIFSSIKTGLIFLVVSCPCSLVLSVPLSYFAGIGVLSKNGILIKGGSAIDNTAKVNTVVFDKTGTITKNNLSVEEIHCENIEKNRFIELTVSIMKNSNHPLCNAYADSITGAVKSKSNLGGFTEIAGYGIKGVVDGKNILCGNKALMEKNSVKIPEQKGTVVYCAVNGEYKGYIRYTETIKEGAFKLVQRLNTLSVSNIFLMSGDKHDSVANIGNKVGIKQVYAELKPHEKMSRLEEIMIKNQNRSRGSKVMFVGDGINDSAVLARSDTGVAISPKGGNVAGVGAGVVINAADAVIIDDDIGKVYDIIKTGRKTKNIVIQNIVFSLLSKFAIMLISLLWYQSMELAIIADVGVALLCVINSLRVLADNKEKILAQN